MSLNLLPDPEFAPPRGPDAAVVRFPGKALPRLHLSPPHLAGGEMEALRDTLDSGWVAPAGPMLPAFEAAVGRATGFSHVAAVASGTAALHLGYRVLDLAPGDEVWTSTLTFVATIAPAVQMGAVPRFLDVDPASWTMDPDVLRTALHAAATRGRLPRMVVPVDLYGQCADLEPIIAICDRWGVPVMSDSAEAMGALHRGRPAGTGARIAVFSFNGNKIVTAGGGGALCSEDAHLVARARFLGSQAKEVAAHYQHETTGYSYGLSSVLAAVGLAQLGVLEARVAARRQIFERYVEGLRDLPGLSFMPEPAWGRSTRWLSVIMIDPHAFGVERETVRRTLDTLGIESRPVWKPLHLQPAFRGSSLLGTGVATSLFERGLCLPSGSGLEPAQQARVIEAIRGCRRG